MNPDSNDFSWEMLESGNPEGATLLWMHGFMGSASEWEPFVEEHFPDFHNIMVDLPGHGGSPLREEMDISELLSRLSTQLILAKYSSLIPIGYSMGGRIAMHLANMIPEKIPQLIILSGAPGLKTENERFQRRQLDEQLMDKLETVGFHEFLMDWYGLPIFGGISKNKKLMPELIRSRSKNQMDQLRLSLRCLGNGALPSLWESLKTMDIPTLLISGDEDVKYVTIHNEMMAQLAHGKQKIIENSGHAFHLEKPLETAAAIRHFLSLRNKGENSDSN